MKKYRKIIIASLIVMSLIVLNQFKFSETGQHFINDRIILTDKEDDQPILEDQQDESSNFELLNSETRQPNGLSGLMAMEHDVPNPEKEIISKRDRVAKHYSRDDGKIEAIISSGSVHYKTQTGAWEDINTALIPTNKANYTYENTTNNLRSWFPKDLTKHGVIVTSDDGALVMGKNLKMNYTDENGNLIKTHNFKASRPISSANIVNYNNVLSAIDNQYIIKTDKIKHNIILNKQPNIPENATYVSFSEEIVLPENWKLTFDQNQAGLVILNKENKVYLRVPPPQVYTKNDPSILAAAHDTGYELIKLNTANNTYQVNTTISTTWLLNSSYPVIVDPTVQLDYSKSGYVRYEYRIDWKEGSEHCGNDYETILKNRYTAYKDVDVTIKKNRNYAIYKTRFCRFDKKFGFGIDFYTLATGDQDMYMGYIDFDTSTIPDGSNIQSVYFKGDYQNNELLKVDISSHELDLEDANVDAADMFSAILDGTKHASKVYGGIEAIQFYPLTQNNAPDKLKQRLSENSFQIGLKSSFNTHLITDTRTFSSENSKLKVLYDIRDDGPCLFPTITDAEKSFIQTIYLDESGNAFYNDPDINPTCGKIKSYGGPPAFTCNDLGINHVTLIAYHSNDSSSWEIEGIVKVESIIEPTIVCMESIILMTDLNSCVATNVDLGQPEFTSQCGGEIITNDAPATFPIGETIVTWRVTNRVGIVECEQLIYVKDEENPVITASDAINQTANPGDCHAMVTIDDATATDNCTVGAVTGTRDDGLGLEEAYPVGTTTITWTATDINENDAEAVIQTVTVTDDELPIITASAAITQTADDGECGATVTIVDATATDNCNVGTVTGTRDDGEALTKFIPLGQQRSLGL